MRFDIPQFIDIEDKLFGNLTFKQFIYVIGGLGWVFIMWSLLPLFLAILISAPVVTLAALLAFKPVGGRPFSVTLESGIKYLFGSKLYLWKKERAKTVKIQTTSFNEKDILNNLKIPRINTGKLDSLSWALDVKTNKQEVRKGK